MQIKEVVQYLKDGGIVFDGAAVTSPNWVVHRVYLRYKEQVDTVLMAESVFSEFSGVEITGCVRCKNYRQYYCHLLGDDVKIPPGIFKNGCEHFKDGRRPRF